MVIDSSAIIAILLGELDGVLYARAIRAAPEPRMSVVSALEVSLVMGGRRHELGLARFDRFLKESRIALIPFDAAQYRLARQAWWTYGKGRHPAALNLGDCCSYALAKATGDVLLYKGTDFNRTDVRGAM